MPDQPIDAAPTSDVWAIQPPAAAVADLESADSGDQGASSAEAPQRRRSSRPARTDWRLGGRTVHRWREGLLALALVSLGAAVLLASLVTTVWGSPWAAASATVLIWIGMLLPVVWAFARSRPVGLLRLRPLDLLYGLVLGALLRTSQGWIEGLGGMPAAFPTLLSVEGAPPAASVAMDVIAPIVVAPVVEELFFRGVVLIALYTVLRRPFGPLTAALVAALASTALFVLVHGITGAADVSGVIALSMLGVVCALLVLLTGRIWGAVLVHVVYNGTYVALAVIGSLLTELS